MSKHADGQASLGDTGDDLGRRGASWGVGAGAVISEFADQRINAGLEEVACDLHQQFPDASIKEITSLVEGVWDHFANARIRDFLPVLVRRQAREELRDHLERGAAKGLPIGDGSHGRR